MIASLTRRIAPAVALSLSLLAPALAEERAQSPQDEELVFRTRLEEAARRGAWKEVVECYGALRARGVEEPRLALRYADAQEALGEVEAASAALETMLEARADHLAALPRLARLRARAGKPAEAAELLVRCARAGGFVLRDLAEARGPLEPLLRDPVLVLRVLAAPRGFEPAAKAPRDPFAAPSLDDGQGGGGVVPPSGPSPERLALEADIDRCLKQVEGLADASDIPGLAEQLRRLAQLLTRYEALDEVQDEERKQKLETWRTRLGRYEGLYDSVRLQLSVTEGNGHLRAMAEALSAHEPQVALERHRALCQLADRLEGEALQVFRRTGETLRLRGEGLARKARTLVRVGKLKLEVTGIVIPPTGDGVATAIVDDRVYREGDRLEVDELDVRVVSISRSVVRLRADDVELVKTLKGR